MKSIGEMSLGELGAYVCTCLEERDVRVTLSGGACVSIYTDNKYQSLDLDFIVDMPVTRKRLKQILAGIGFQEKDRYFTHVATEFFLEFPPGPLAVGEEAITDVRIVEYATGRLRLISPTDCVKDRLAAWFHWDDGQSLDQAVLVTKDQEIDLLEIRKWAERENELDKFEIFMESLTEK